MKTYLISLFLLYKGLRIRGGHTTPKGWEEHCWLHRDSRESRISCIMQKAVWWKKRGRLFCGVPTT